MLSESAWTWAENSAGAVELGVARTQNQPNLEKLVNQAFDRIAIPDIGRPRTYVIKPNFGFATDEKGGTTSLALLEAVLKKIRRDLAPLKILVVESDGIAFRCEEVFELLGLEDLCIKYQASLLNLSKLPRTPMRFPICQVIGNLSLPPVLLDDDTILVNLGKIKTHEIAGFSGAIKNLFGLNPNIFKIEYHPRIHDVLCDIYQIFKPHLTLIDGRWAVDGHGPWMGTPVHLGVLIASNDPLVADLAALRLIGWQPEDIQYISRLLEGRPWLSAICESLPIRSAEEFNWVPAAKLSNFKERIALLLIPLLKRGLPLIFPSQGRVKIARYAANGQYCRSITSWPDVKAKRKAMDKNA